MYLKLMRNIENKCKPAWIMTSDDVKEFFGYSVKSSITDVIGRVQDGLNFTPLKNSDLFTGYRLQKLETNKWALFIPDNSVVA